MNEITDNRELEHKFELLEKDYKIMEANVDGTLKDLRTDIERNNTEVANKIHAQTKWMIGIVVAAVVIIIGAVSLLTQI